MRTTEHLYRRPRLPCYFLDEINYRLTELVRTVLILPLITVLASICRRFALLRASAGANSRWRKPGRGGPPMSSYKVSAAVADQFDDLRINELEDDRYRGRYIGYADHLRTPDCPAGGRRPVQ